MKKLPAILIMWGRPLVCRLRCLWLRWRAETSRAGRDQSFTSVLPPYYPKMRIAEKLLTSSPSKGMLWLHSSGCKRGRLLFLFLAVICASPQLALAQTNAPEGVAALKKMSVEDLMDVEIPTVYGASKHEQKVTEAPSSVSIVTSSDIKQYGYRTLADVLRGVRGFNVTSDRYYSYIGARGINRPGDYGDRILLMVDGHRVNEPIYDQAFSGTEGLVDVDMIERVEVIRGPGSSLYGNNAFFAVINVITRKGRDLNGTEVSSAVASYDTYTGRASYGRVFTNGVELAMSGTYLDSDGHKELFYPEYRSVQQGIARGLDGNTVKSAISTLSYRDFTLQGAIVHRRKDLPNAPFGTVFGQPGTFAMDERGYVDLKYSHGFENDLAVTARVYFDHYQFDAHNMLPSIVDFADPLYPGQVIKNRDFSEAELMGAEMLASKPLFDDNVLTAGSEVIHDFYLAQRNYDILPRADYFDTRNRNDTVGVYVQDEYQIFHGFAVNGGLRYDYFSTFGDTFNPRMSMVYQPVTKSTFKFLYGEAFRAPNASEMYYAMPGYKPNLQLKSEKVHSYELVFEQELNSHARLQSSLFLNEIDGLIDSQRDPSDNLLYAANLNSVQSRGAEMELDGHWGHGWRGKASYTFQESRDSDSGQFLSNSPKHMAKLNLIIPLYLDKISAGLELQGTSKRWTVERTETGAFWIANATLFSRELVKNLEISASIYNVFDCTYRDPVSADFSPLDAVQQDGRNFRVKLTYRF